MVCQIEGFSFREEKKEWRKGRWLAPSVKGLPLTHEDLSVDSQHPQTNHNICNSSSGKVGIGNFLQLTGQLIYDNLNIWVSGRLCLKKMNWRTIKEDIILCPPLISIHLQLIHTYTWASHMHTKSHAYTSAKYT